jgi:hypothetical protein
MRGTDKLNAAQNQFHYFPLHKRFVIFINGFSVYKKNMSNNFLKSNSIPVNNIATFKMRPLWQLNVTLEEIPENLPTATEAVGISEGV